MTIKINYLRMKKIKYFMFLLVLFMATAAFSQQKKVTLSLKNVTVKTALEALKAQSGLSYWINANDVDMQKVISVNLKSKKVEDALKTILQGQDVRYQLSGDHIVISKATRAVEPKQEIASPSGEMRKITGKVTDEKGQPLPGVTVVVNGTTKGTITDANGNYSLQNVSPNETLEFSFVGMQKSMAKVGDHSVINVIMTESTTGLNEVVVVGYGSMQKKDLTTAISTVSTQNIAVRPLANLGDAIQGMAAGVQVVSPSGAPGEGISIRVRGSTSVLAGNDPLYVIDGVPTTDMSSIDPQDIQSIQILKDASSAAIYGARAANGVIIITTKRGKIGQTSVSYNGFAGVSYLGTQRVKALNTPEYRSLMDEILGAGSVPTSITTDTNWMNETFKTGTTQNHQVDISTGSEKNQTFISLGYLDQKGIIHPSSYDRYNFRMNNNMDLYKWLKVSSSVSYANSLTNGIIQDLGSDRGGVILSAINTPPMIGIWDSNNPSQYQQNPFQSSWESPIAYLSRTNTTRDNHLLGDINAQITFLRDFKYKTNFGVDYDGYQNDQFTDPIRTSYGRQQNGTGSTNRSTSLVWVLENTLTYDKVFKNNTLNILLGQSMQSSRYDNIYLSGQDFPKTLAVSTLNAANQLTNGGTQISEWAISSFFGRVMYNYNNKYLLTANLRYDGSSKLATNNQWGLFPSVSVGWRISEEPFYAPLKSVMNDLKIRAGIGKNGNQNGLADYAWPALYSFGRVTPTSPLSGPSIYQTTIENSSLKWETTTQTDAGLDAYFFNSLFNLSIDAYVKNTDGLLMNVPLPEGAAPVDYITRNDGQMQNWGMEFSLNTRNHSGDWSWDAGLQISFNRNKIKSLGLAQIYDYALTPNNQYAVRVAPGYSLGTFYGYVSEGVDPETGNMIYKDLNHNGVIDPGDRTVIGHAQPNFIYGMNGSVSYKGIGLSFLLQGTQGNNIFNASRIATEGMFDSKNQSTAVLNRWERPGQITNIPRTVSDGSTYNVCNSSRFVEDGSYLRVKSITLSYSFPAKLIRPLLLQDMMIYATGNNLFTWTRYSGFDPEVNYMGNDNVVQGVDFGTYPQYQTVIFGLKLKF